MINDVKDGVIAAIAAFKGADTKIYSEKIPQGFEEPCFFVRVLNTSQNRELGRRYKRGNNFVIRYFPGKTRKVNKKLLEVAELLYDNLEYISVVGKLTMGLDMRHETIDDVLHFFVRYPFHVFKKVPVEPIMENLEQKGAIKGG